MPQPEGDQVARLLADSQCGPHPGDDCNNIVRYFVPYCTSSCYDDCARYQAHDVQRTAHYAFGRYEDQSHNLILVALNYDTKLFPHHIDGARMYDFSQPVAAVARHPNDPNIWGLKNLSGGRWVCTTAGGADKDVAPGRSVTLAPATKINFGKSQGEVCR